MMVRDVSIEGNRVDFMKTTSEIYGRMYARYRQWLCCHFTEEEVRSIYCHEAVHWLRLLPYKIRKNDRLAAVFYTGLLKVLADIREGIYVGG